MLAAAATAARTGLPIIRPLALADPGDDRGWTISDSYLFGPSLWVAPVLEEAAERRRAYLPRGRWRDFWTGAAVEGGRDVVVPAPLDRIPVWVREGSIVVTHPAESVAHGLGEDGVSDPPGRGDPLGAAAVRPRQDAPRRRHPDRLARRDLVDRPPGRRPGARDPPSCAPPD